MSEKLYLLEIDGTDGVTVNTYRLCTGTGFTSTPTDSPPNVFSEPRIIQPGLFRQSMYAQGTTSGASSGANGETVLLNGDGGLDNLMDLGFDGQRYVLKEGYVGTALSQFATVITGAIEQAEFSWDRLSLRLKDRTMEMNVPVQDQMYAGSNSLPDGLDGTIEIKGKIKPILLGQCNNITPVCINTAKLLYQLNQGAVFSIPKVCDNGVELTLGVDYATSTLLEDSAYFYPYTDITFALGMGTGFSGLTVDALKGCWLWVDGIQTVHYVKSNTATTVTLEVLTYDHALADISFYGSGPGEATYDTCLAEGLFRLGSMPAGQITCDAIQGDTVAKRTVAQIVKYLAEKKLIKLDVEIATVPISTGSGTLTTPSTGLYRYTGNGAANVAFMSTSLLEQGTTYKITGTIFGNGSITPLITHNGVVVWTGVPAENTWAQTVNFTFMTGVGAANLYVGFNAIGALTTVSEFIELTQLSVKKVLGTWVAQQPIFDLDIQTPYPIGIYIDSNITYTQALDIICQSVGAWWGFDNLGVFWVQQLNIPVNYNTILTLTNDECLSIERVATADGGGKEVPVWKADRDYGTIDGGKGVPVWRVNMFYNKNWTKQTSGLAGSVSADRVNALSLDYNRVASEDSSVKRVHKLASEIMTNTLLVNEPDAQLESLRVLNLRKVRRDRLRVSVPKSVLAYSTGGYWDNEAITELSSPRYGHESVVYNNFLYVIGGRHQTTGVSTASVVRLDLNNPTGAWDDIGVTDLPEGRESFTAEIHNGFLYVIGGGLAAGSTASVIRLNLNVPNGAWDDAGVTDLPYAVANHSSAVYNNVLYVFGGFTTARDLITTCLDLSVPSGAWNDAGVTNLPLGRFGHSSVVYGSYVYVVGGFTTVRSVGVLRLNLNTPTGAWDDIGVTDMPVAMSSPPICMLGSLLCVVGGYTTAETSIVRALDLNNPTGAWETNSILSLPDARYTHTLAVYGNALYLVGGYTTAPKSNTWRLRRNSNPEDIAYCTSLGKVLTMKFPRYGYTNGRPMKIIGVESNFADSTLTLDLWG
jgi:hypothetical protein